MRTNGQPSWWLLGLTATCLVTISLVVSFTRFGGGIATAGPLHQSSPCGVETTGGTLPPVLTRVVVLPAGASVASGGTLQFEAHACDNQNALITTNISGSWSVSAGSINSSGRFTAPTVAGATTVTVSVLVTHTSTSTSGSAQVTVNPVVVDPTPTPIPAYTSPTPVAPPKPQGITTQDLVLPDRQTVVVATEPASGARLAELVVPAGAATVPIFVQIGTLAEGAQTTATIRSKLPGTLLLIGTRLIEIDIVDAAGKPFAGQLSKSIDIRIPYTDSEAAAAGGQLNLSILKYDEAAGSWSSLQTTVDVAKKELSARVTGFSVFSLGRPAAGVTATPTAAPQATATPAALPALPQTGGFAPTGQVLLVMLGAGVVLSGAGVLLLRRKQV